MEIAKISKGILNKIRKKYYSFLWAGKRAKEGIQRRYTLDQMEQAGNPQEVYEVGAKKYSCINLSLVESSLCKLVYNEGLQDRFMSLNI